MTVRIWIFGFAVSLLVHGAVLRGHEFEAQTEGAEAEAPAASASEMSAISAFEALDQERKIEATMSEVIAQIPDVDFSDIKLPEPEPKPKPSKKPAESTPKAPKATPSAESNSVKKDAPSANTAKAQQSSTKAPVAPAYSAEQRARAKSDFGGHVRAAIAQNIRVPRNVSGVRAVVSVRFQNGQLVGYGLSQSSGHAGFDNAVIAAVKTARFPRPSAATPADVSYNLPLSIN